MTAEVGADPDEGGYRAFWADAIADDIEARSPEEPIVIKGGVSPSGVPHIGHFNEIMRGFFVAEALRERGRAVRQVFTADDRDALRAIPRRLADADWNLVGLDEVDAEALGRNLGRPYTDVPDPFGTCHDSYGDHFTALLAESAALIGVPVEVVSNTDLYDCGAFDPAIRTLLAERDRARRVLAEFQAGVAEDYVPFRPQCSACGRLTTTVTAVDLDAGTVAYACTSMEAGGRTIEGCGHRGTGGLREGKLPWRFEWPAQWQLFGVDFEPFGKDHAEGSWPSGEAIAREVLGIEPPVPMTYEWFTLDGEALSSSSGNVVTVADVLDLIEPEALRYFFAKRPGKQRDLDLARIDRLVDEFDRFEASYYGEAGGDAETGRLADRAYPAVLPLVLEPAGDPEEGSGAVTVAKLTGPGEGGSIPIGTVDSALETAERLGGDGPDRYAPANDPEARAAIAGVRESAFADRARLPYTFAAVLGMTDVEGLRREMARREGHLVDDAPAWAVVLAMDRVERARRWARRTDNEYNYRLRADRPEVSFAPAIAAALEDLATAVDSGASADEIQAAVYEAADRHGVEASEVFGAGYELFLGQAEGPRLGPFLAALDRGFVVDRLRGEG